MAKDRELLSPATVYLAPDLVHTEVNESGRITLTDGAPMDGFRPSATVLFESVAHSYGPAGIAVIMTGMGKDGLSGLQVIKAAGGRIVAQDRSSSVVYGMPGAAVAAGVTDVVLPLAAIVSQLSTQVYDE